ncbi:hypothetical protein [Lysobacter sp. N42]|uniref:hypothetical protein n=1 Tax=Lysobacter sp. N42 TaxID=2545719 RepID=UPI00104F0E86|nr:hypothetical protein [Lysobacter sp. N42]TCZ80370.1 hypothetical protein EYQ95_24870 [Lysobacter sp. N42]
MKMKESLAATGDRLARTLCASAAPQIEHVPNKHVDGQMDQVETRRCEAGTSTIYRGATTSDPNGLPIFVQVNVQGAGLPPYLEIGQPVERVTQFLGKPQETGPGTITYGLSMEGIDTATILHAGGQVTSVRWEWVVD